MSKMYMKRLALLCLVVFVFIGCAGIKKNSLASINHNREWNLVFEENFDKDLSQWNVWQSGAFNDEIQYYRPEQLQLTNGILTIHTQSVSLYCLSRAL